MATASVGSYEAKTHLAELLDRVARGERITITRHGTPVAMLVPASQAPRRDLDAVIAELKDFRRGRTLGGLRVRDLREEGRR